jgi:hypothetical protein
MRPAGSHPEPFMRGAHFRIRQKFWIVNHSGSVLYSAFNKEIFNESTSTVISVYGIVLYEFYVDP